MKDTFSTRQKRNKPCENCRTHRRKCVNVNNSICERCGKLNLECIFKLTEKPAKSIKPSISPAKRNKLFDTIWCLNQEADLIQLQLAQLQESSNSNSPIPCQCQDPTQCQHIKSLLPLTHSASASSSASASTSTLASSASSASSSSSTWHLTISNNHRGIQLQTSIQSMSDLSFFIKEAFSVFIYGDRLPGHQDFSERRNPKQLLAVTHKSLAVEAAFRSVFSIQQEPPPPPPLPEHVDPAILQKQIRYLKLQMIKVYFNCYALLNPIFIHTWHYPQLQRNPDGLLATVVASYVAYSSCTHIEMTGFSFSRVQFAEHCRMEAKELLQDALFEGEPSIDACLALYVMCGISILTLKGKEARIQSSLCWQIVIQLKATYLHHRVLPDTLENMINAEVWKRLFFAARFVEFNFSMAYDGVTDFSNIVHHLDIALPSLLPCEVLDDRLTKAVLCYQYVSRLTTHSAGTDTEILGLRLMAGVIDAVPSHIIQYLEHTLMQLWDSIPEPLRLGSGPYRLIDPKCVEACDNASVLRFNLVFYIYWMNFQSRTMEEPAETDLTAAAFSRIDGDRALIIASICSDAASKIFKRLFAVMPCAIELHWITMCLDILKMLSCSANVPVKQRASENLAELSHVLFNKLSGIGKESTYAFASHAPYLMRIKRLISSYMIHNS
ncbi:Zn(2)-C6 fungal-specific transcription factor [Mucor lusitanicus]|uniref:Zn(2)-C6 fungal-specific transcription factor n=1 Tax=Mucor circinelloides f. lusitanicus TaxID=29924 RepID=A0A8H4BAI2_MUCCL|nr:Zn(2)-C6 fungal-specific transcription factor [Mucor lusitanicus]